MELAISFGYYDEILSVIAASLSGGALPGTITTVRLPAGLLPGGSLIPYLCITPRSIIPLVRPHLDEPTP